MAVMLVPAATLAPATAATTTAAGHDHGMHHDHAAAASGAGPLALPSLLVVLLLALVAVLVVTRLPEVVRRGAPAAGRARRRLRGAHGRRDGGDARAARLATPDPYQRSA